MSKDYYEDYWSPVGGFGTTYVGTHPELIQLLQQNVSHTARCLDVGCGNGRAAGLWLNKNARSYVGVDISENAVRQAEQLGLDARVIQNVAALPFPDCSFDVAICTEVFEHLFAPHMAALEINRCLRPGGILIATVPNIAFWRRRVDVAFGRWHPMGDHLSVQQPWRDPHVRFFTVGAFRRMLLRAGFFPIYMGGHGGGFLNYIPYLRRLLPSTRPSALYRSAERLAPSLLALSIQAVATKPASRP